MQKKRLTLYLGTGLMSLCLASSFVMAGPAGTPVSTPDEISLEQRKEMISLLKDISASSKKSARFTQETAEALRPPSQQSGAQEGSNSGSSS